MNPAARMALIIWSYVTGFISLSILWMAFLVFIPVAWVIIAASEGTKEYPPKEFAQIWGKIFLMPFRRVIKLDASERGLPLLLSRWAIYVKETVPEDTRLPWACERYNDGHVILTAFLDEATLMKMRYGGLMYPLRWYHWYPTESALSDYRNRIERKCAYLHLPRWLLKPLKRGCGSPRGSRSGTECMCH